MFEFDESRITAILAYNGHFGSELVVILVINLTAILAIRRSFSYWTGALLVITLKVGVELVIHQLVQFSVSFLPVSDLPLSNQSLS